MILPTDPQVLQLLHQHSLTDPILRRRVLMHCLAHWSQETPECAAWLQETRRVRLLPDAVLAPLAGDASRAYLYKLLHQIANSRDYLALGVLVAVETDLADRPHSDMQRMRFELMVDEHTRRIEKYGYKLLGQFGEYLQAPGAWRQCLAAMGDACWRDPHWDNPTRYPQIATAWIADLDRLLRQDQDVPARLDGAACHPDRAQPGPELVARHAAALAWAAAVQETLLAQGITLRVFGSVLRGVRGARRFHDRSDVDLLLPGDRRADYDAALAVVSERSLDIDIKVDLVWQGQASPAAHAAFFDILLALKDEDSFLPAAALLQPL